MYRTIFLFMAIVTISVTSSISLRAADLLELSGVADLPLRSRLIELAPAARAKALATLTKIPGLLREAEHLQIDFDGGMYLTNCAHEEGEAHSAAGAPLVHSSESAGPISINAQPAYSSKPGSPNTLYLDFNGEVITGTNWNITRSVTSWTALPYDTDGDPTQFSDTEQDAIFLIWQRVAEDYRPFDVNVTTALPASFGPRVGRALITKSIDAFGVTCPSAIGIGGIAFVDAFGDVDYSYAKSPAWVYYDNLSSGQEDVVAEAVSHELGHNMGLSHDGLTTPATVYYPGQGPSGFTWAPIMGDSYRERMTQWSRGEYLNANNQEDDLAIIAEKLTYIADDFGDTTTAATNLTVVAGGGVRTITPFDGLISSTLDSDLFRFSSSVGTVAFTVIPRTVTSGNGSISPSTPGANLDVQIDILDSVGVPVAGLSSNPIDNCVGTISGSIAIAGTYYLRVRGDGNRNPVTDGYSNYDSVGIYRVSGTLPLFPENLAPVVNAGPDQGNPGGAVANLTGSVTDDGLPLGSPVTQIWTVVSGPGTVVFSNATSLVTTATFSVDGSYVLRLTATDGSLTSSDDITISLNLPPVVDAGSDRTVIVVSATQPVSAPLLGIVSDDGLPTGSTVAVVWTTVSGPGTVTYSSTTAIRPTATFSAEGVYVLRLTATDGNRSASDTVTFTLTQPQVVPANEDGKCGLGGFIAILLAGISITVTRLRSRSTL